MKRAKAALLAATLAALTLAPAQQATAAPRLSISSSEGGARASTDGPTTFQVTGSGFQALPNAFGGIYVMFGWVSDPAGGLWKPSRGGRTGAELLYVPDSESKGNQGYQRFISFPGSSTGDSANGGTVSEDGTLAFNLTVPGPRFTAQDRSGNSKEIDCLQVQCGIITVGAHGVVNAANESFTPISFGSGNTSESDVGQAQTQRSVSGQSASSQSTAAQPAAAAASPSASGSPAPEVPATLGLSQATVQAGRVLGFTGQGFDAGEQVVATVGAGLAGVGPLTAGRFGEVAGAITLPVDMRAGSHTVTLTAAGSGRVAEATLSVLADPATASAGAAQVEQTHDGWRVATIAVGGAAAVLLLLVISSLVTAIVRRGRAKRSGKVRVARPGAAR